MRGVLFGHIRILAMRGGIGRFFGKEAVPDAGVLLDLQPVPFLCGLINPRTRYDGTTELFPRRLAEVVFAVESDAVPFNVKGDIQGDLFTAGMFTGLHGGIVPREAA
jgi:hypothetical protein